MPAARRGPKKGPAGPTGRPGGPGRAGAGRTGPDGTGRAGAGREPALELDRGACSPCRGTGRLSSSSGGEPHEVGCPWCGGTGRFEAGRDAQAAEPAEGGRDAWAAVPVEGD